MGLTRIFPDMLKMPDSNLTTNGGFDLESINDVADHEGSVWTDMANYHEGVAFFIVHTNDGANDALTASITQATSAGGGSAKALSGAGYAAVTIPAGSADFVVKVPFSTDMLDRTNDFQFVNALLVAAGNTDTMVTSAFIVRGRPRYADETLPD